MGRHPNVDDGYEAVVHFLFFSSRRRHTRSKRDWSSDVCSSDLFLRTIRVLSRPARRARSGPSARNEEIGRASCRERVEVSVVGGALKEEILASVVLRREDSVGGDDLELIC